KTGTLKLGDRVEARVDTALRERTMRNHSVTHLMHKALREVLGPHVQQRGSLVDADKTRFDFSHHKPMTEDEIREVEARVNAQLQEFRELARQLRAQPGPGMAEKALASLLEEKRALEKELSRMRSKLLSGQGTDLSSQAVEVRARDGQVMRVLAVTLDDADPKTMRETVDRLKDKLKSAAIVLGAVNDGKVSLIAGVTADLTARVKAGELVNYVAQQVGGKGGGRPDMAQAGGTNPAGLPGALQSVKSWVEQRV